MPRSPAASPSPPKTPDRRAVPAAPPRGALISGSLLLIVALAIGLATLGGGRPVFQGLDDQWMNLMRGSSSDTGTGLARVLDRLGGPLGMILPLMLAGCLGVYGRWRSSVFVLASGVGGNIVVVLPLKWLIDRPRPPQPWVLVNEGSFPSGQVFTVTTLVLGVGVVLLPTVPRRCWWVFATALVIAMMWSRTWLHAQWLSDTVAGAAAGAGVVLLLWSAFAPLLQEEAVRAASGRLLE